MLKLLIADDEPKIRRGLTKALNWRELDIEVVDTAEDGTDALDKAKQYKPDIVFVDICMPFLNGLDLIEQLNIHIPESAIIIITGHDEFEYAQRAVKLNVVDYIVKPVDIDSLKEAVVKAKKLVIDNRESNLKNTMSQKQLDDNYELIRDSFLKRLLVRELDSHDIKEYIDYLKIDIRGFTGIFIIKPLDNMITRDMKYKFSKELLRFSIINIVKDVSYRYKPFVVFEDNKGNIVVLLTIKSVSDRLELAITYETAIEKHISHNTIISQDTINGGCEDIISKYEDLIKDNDVSSRLNPTVVRAKRYIEKYYYKQDLTLDEVASHLNLSTTYLSRLIKGELGVSFSTYLTQTRINKAIHFLNGPSIKMYEIAEQVGYSTQHYFSAAFKKIMGVSPLMYRNNGGQE